MRDKHGKPLVIDRISGDVTPFDKPGVLPDLNGTLEENADTHRTVFHLLVERYLDTKFAPETVSGKVGIDWTPDLAGTDSTLVYATYSRGYRPGAFNPPVDPTLFSGVAPQTEPEFIDAIEIGMKNVLFDNTMIFSSFF